MKILDSLFGRGLKQKKEDRTETNQSIFGISRRTEPIKEPNIDTIVRSARNSESTIFGLKISADEEYANSDNPTDIFNSSLGTDEVIKIRDFTIHCFFPKIKNKYHWAALYQFYLFKGWLKTNVPNTAFADFCNTDTIFPQDQLPKRKSGEVLVCTYNSLNDFAMNVPTLEKWHEQIQLSLQSEEERKKKKNSKTSQRTKKSVDSIYETIQQLNKEWDYHQKQ